MNRRFALGIVALVLAAGIVATGFYLYKPPSEPFRSGAGGPQDGPVAEPNGSGTATQPGGSARPGKWAAPVELPGCPNLHKVSGDLYRGAQPTAEGMKELRKLGVRTIVNLRSFHSDRDEMKEAAVDFRYEHITMKAWHAEDKEIVRFLRIVGAKENLPVFVHCQHGADRTGTMCAIYRVAVQGWSKEDALREMQDGGYGFHGVWQNLLRYLENLDIEEMKRRAAQPE